MVTKEVLQKFVDDHADVIAEILPGGLKDKDGKWILVCPLMERFDLDFSKVKVQEKVEEVVETPTVVVEETTENEKPKKKRTKKNK